MCAEREQAQNKDPAQIGKDARVSKGWLHESRYYFMIIENMLQEHKLDLIVWLVCDLGTTMKGWISMDRPHMFQDVLGLISRNHLVETITTSWNTFWTRVCINQAH